jgi:hypothetical protein
MKAIANEFKEAIGEEEKKKNESNRKLRLMSIRRPKIYY